jgi:hypothetical protein
VERVTVVEQVIHPAIGAQGNHVVNEAGTADPGNADLPLALSPLLNLHTNVASRSARGWIFFPCVMDSALIADREWTVGIYNNMQDVAAVLDNSFDLGSVFPTHVNPVVYSRTRHKNGLDPHAFQITSASSARRPHYLRSRDTSP